MAVNYAEQFEMSTEKPNNNSRAGRKKGASRSPERGLRFTVECEKVFGKVTNTALAGILNFADKTISGWKEGANIDNKALARMIDLGVDVPAILGAAKRHSEPVGAVAARRLSHPPDNCPNHGVCASFAMLLNSLAKILDASSVLVDVDQRAVAEKTIQDLIEQARQGLGKVQKASSS